MLCDALGRNARQPARCALSLCLVAHNLVSTPAGKRLAFVDSKALDQLAALLRRACALREAAGQAGWLLRMATDDRAPEDFVAVHNSILEILQVKACEAEGKPRLR